MKQKLLNYDWSKGLEKAKAKFKPFKDVRDVVISEIEHYKVINKILNTYTDLNKINEVVLELLDFIAHLTLKLDTGSLIMSRAFINGPQNNFISLTAPERSDDVLSREAVLHYFVELSKSANEHYSAFKDSELAEAHFLLDEHLKIVVAFIHQFNLPLEKSSNSKLKEILTPAPEQVKEVLQPEILPENLLWYNINIAKAKDKVEISIIYKNKKILHASSNDDNFLQDYFSTMVALNEHCKNLGDKTLMLNFTNKAKDYISSRNLKLAKLENKKLFKLDDIYATLTLKNSLDYYYVLVNQQTNEIDEIF